MGLNRAQMADANQIDRPNYGRFEMGQRGLPLEVGFAIAERYLVTMDWIYRGRWEGMPLDWVERLRGRE